RPDDRGSRRARATEPRRGLDRGLRLPLDRRRRGRRDPRAHRVRQRTGEHRDGRPDTGRDRSGAVPADPAVGDARVGRAGCRVRRRRGAASGSGRLARRMTRRPATPIHNRIAVLRAERGLSRQDVADALGINYQTVGYIERGEYNPSLDLAFAVAEFFELPLEAVFSPRPFEPMSSRLYGRAPSDDGAGAVT